MTPLNITALSLCVVLYGFSFIMGIMTQGSWPRYALAAVLGWAPFVVALVLAVWR